MQSSPCGIGGPQNPDGSCTGTYGNSLASQAGAHVFDGVHTTNVVVALLAAGAILAAVLFVRLMAAKVGSFFAERRERLARDRKAAETHYERWHRDFDWEGYGQSLHDVGWSPDADGEDDAEVDAEDDMERDDALEYKPDGRA